MAHAYRAMRVFSARASLERLYTCRPASYAEKGLRYRWPYRALTKFSRLTSGESGSTSHLPRVRVLHQWFFPSCLLSQSFCFPAHVESRTFLMRREAKRFQAMRCDAMYLGPIDLRYFFSSSVPTHLESRFLVSHLCFLLCFDFADRRRRTTECRGSSSCLRLCDPGRTKATSRAIPKRRRQRNVQAKDPQALFALVLDEA
jgi:hypothetical protein